MSKVEQTQEELKQHLDDHVRFLISSAAAFDGGFHGEAKRLAATVRVLLHDTARSKSLLGLLGEKEKLAYVNTANPLSHKNLLSHSGLVNFRADKNGVNYHAPLGDGPPSRQRPKVSFGDWWGEIVILDSAGERFSRKDLVLALTNKDGGAHVDPDLGQAYASLTRGNSLGWEASSVHGMQAMQGVEMHSSRQIAYELLQTLRDAGLTRY
ncbi:hypothetical protein C1924_00835 [Stenotrophomonas sp. ESTM1D_MKCIP4_1]|uniref:hypothetical protein n=1 Tax=Stenotrophomonas sp. ESTM1D_MKCIP4_1 TaxID=2072414 RepID=UPI000D541931|nr:hypothetical protein [Stenotrophomonas sp. ESTM1D_MKCIP4_1]AWH51840.1 hypothetical protein C1924_00835 [Stenotrophomonas sp. ESTM1D_MKCIP4_1]